MCSSCSKREKQTNRDLKRKNDKCNQPAKINAPISQTSSSRLKVTIQQCRIENKQLKQELEKLQREISEYSVPVQKDLGDDLITIMKDTDNNRVTPFMKMFWEEQQKYLTTTNKTSVRYHPMIIRYCLGLVAKSSSAYDQMRYDEKSGTGFLVLPSRRRLRDYKKYIRP